MKKQTGTILIWASVVLGLISFVMMFLPQIAITAETSGSLAVGSGTVNWISAFFKGETYLTTTTGETLRLNMTGSPLAFSGYILVGSGALVAILSALCHGRGSRAAFGLLAFVLFVTGMVFIWVIIPNWCYLNGISADGTVYNGFTYGKITYTIWSLIAGITSILASLAVFFGMAWPEKA